MQALLNKASLALARCPIRGLCVLVTDVATAQSCGQSAKLVKSVHVDFRNTAGHDVHSDYQSLHLGMNYLLKDVDVSLLQIMAT